MRYIFLGHLGIGDHIIMNGLVNTLLETDSTIKELCLIIVDDYRRDTVLHLYEGTPRISFHLLKGINGSFDETDPIFVQLNNTNPGTSIVKDDKQYVGIPFGLHSLRKCFWIDAGTTWIDSLYKYPFNISANNRFTHFRLPTNLSRAHALYDTLLSLLGTKKYVVVHDDPSRKRDVDRKTLVQLLEQDTMLNLPVLYLGKSRYDYPLVEGLENTIVGPLFHCVSLFDLYFVLKNASACHLMDSSIACLVDVSGMDGKLYMHNYINEGSGLAFTRSPWVQVNKA